MLTFMQFLQERWEEKLHPRVPIGNEGGGRFTNRYIHYSLMKKDRINRPAETEQSTNDIKPSGLWLSIGSEWDDWCKANKFRQNWNKEKTAVVLKKHAKILRISNAKEIDEFTKKYGVESKNWGTTLINWKKVTGDYQGIIIAPYISSRRNTPHTLWYYGWDIASGCIWDVDAVKELK